MLPGTILLLVGVLRRSLLACCLTLAIVTLLAASFVGRVGVATESTVQQFDVVVYGGTPAGIISSVAAAREGLRVALLEPGAHFGGMVSGGLGRTDHGASVIVGGYAREFFERVGRRYGEPITWYLEPHVAEDVFREMLSEGRLQSFLHHRLREKTGVTKRGTRVERITIENGARFEAKIFVDASYEGDLMAQSGVSYTWGRESTSEFSEPLAGVRERTPKHQFTVRLNPYDGNGRLLPEISSAPKGEFGAADRKVQAYNFRVCMTDRPDNRLPFPKPTGYQANRFELLARMLTEMDKLKPTAPDGAGDTTPPGRDVMYRLKEPWSLLDVMQPRSLMNGKFDTNNEGAFSTDYVGGSHAYPDGDYKTRARIWQEHKEYVQGFVYFLANDPRVPRRLHDVLAPWGLCADEFVDNDHWPYQLYIREARRMRGDFVMSQKDIQIELTKPDSIGMGSYQSDSHNVQRLVAPDGSVENEGDMQVPVKPYQIPYRLMLPKRTQATNLLVPVTFSATHVAYSTLRMEPQYMIIGQAAGVAAKLAIDAQSAVQDVDSAMLSARLRAQRAVLEWRRAFYIGGAQSMQDVFSARGCRG